MRVTVRAPKKAALAIVAGAAAAIAIAAPAVADPVLEVTNATSHGEVVTFACSNAEYPAGGTWNYGACSGTAINFSYYHQPQLKHQSSVSNQKHGVKTSGCVAANTWSQAQQAYDPNGNNKAFYSNDLCR